MSSSTTDPGDRSSAQIEREVENTRAELTDTLDTLRDRMSPGNLMDQAVEYLRGSGGREFASNLGRTVRDNPVPVLLVGAGIGWLLMSGGKSSGSTDAQPRSTPPRAMVRPLPHAGSHSEVQGTGTQPALRPGSPSPESGNADKGSHDRSALKRAGATASGVAERVGDTASQAYDSIAGAVGAAAEGVSSTAGHASERAVELAHDARDYAARAGTSAQQGMNWLLHEQPMVLGGIGLAIGAAVGAMLPTTRVEDRMMGEASDEVARQAKDVAQKGYHRAQESAGKAVEQVKAATANAYEATKDRMDGTGMSASTVGDTLSEAVRDVGEAAKSGIHDAASGVRDTIKESEKPESKENKPRNS